MTIPQLHQLFLQCSEACTDSRNILKDSMFFALKGSNFNGNRFAAEALRKGARFAVVDEAEFASSEKIILVKNVLQHLQALANHHRRSQEAKVVALTGSNGKTTTKELINAVLSRKYRTIATKGNLNNHIGVPLTLLSIKDDTEIAIVEMGANHQGEIRFLCGIAEPDFGYITNFGKAHLEGFGGIEGVIAGKSELYAYLKENGGHIFFNGADAVQQEKIKGYPNKSGFNVKNGPGISITFKGANPFVRLGFGNEDISTQLVGSYNFNNCAAAILIGHHFEVENAAIKKALETYIPANNRSQLIDKNGYHILLDAYNANPSSMKAALDNFALMSGNPKIVFLGDMFELGITAPEEHQEIADLAASKGFEQVYLVGGNFAGVKTALPVFASYDEFEGYIRKQPPAKGSILIKGSRGMALERILQAL